jgi:hypothetical protein
MSARVQPGERYAFRANAHEAPTSSTITHTVTIVSVSPIGDVVVLETPIEGSGGNNPRDYRATIPIERAVALIESGYWYWEDIR